MLAREEYVRMSLELNLFFARIAKEHSIFLESGFTGRDTRFAEEADNFKVKFEGLLSETIMLANGVIGPETASSGEFVTPYTLNAEQVSAYYTGIRINTGLTQAEASIGGHASLVITPQLEQQVYNLNQRAIALTSALAQFKTTVLNNVISCKMFTTNYPLLLDHIIREAHFYLQMLTKLQNREPLLTREHLLEQEVFWNRIMAEHSKFIRGLLDPTEVKLIGTAENFGREFDQLTAEAIAAIDQTTLVPNVTNESLQSTKQLRDFKTAGTQGLINCSIKAIAYPLLGDHVLREANHYIRVLTMLSR
ncbi:MAG: DUF2935 domain-containing protein [Clostridia bacterium]|nr:DUF2935 domain-containing protein [Clostridia bacterium]